MKLITCLILSLIVLVFSIGGLSAAEIKLQKIRELGVMRNMVIFQSTDVKYVKKSLIVRGKIVARWGTDTFEVGNAYYACNQKKYCTFVDYERLAMYESCIVKKKKVSCTKKISGEASIISNDIIVGDAPDNFELDVENGREDLNEFPARIEDEFSDIF